MEFVVDYFLPHLPTTISELVRLIGEAETFESKRRVDNTLNVVIEQTGQQVGIHSISVILYSFWRKISPFVPIIVGPLPQLCECLSRLYVTKHSNVWHQGNLQATTGSSRALCW